MKISRRPIQLDAEIYSKEFNVPRSKGCHLMEVVEYVARAAGFEKQREEDGDKKPDLSNFTIPGFVWENVASRSDKLEHAFSIEAVRLYLTHKPNIVFPGEKFWCRSCDQFMTGAKVTRRHCRKTGHKGIFSTPDAYDTIDNSYVEWKYTFKSARRTEPDVIDTKNGIWKWCRQVEWNCLSLGVRRGKILVLHASSFPPQSYEISFRFKSSELQATKEMIVANAIELGLI